MTEVSLRPQPGPRADIRDMNLTEPGLQPGPAAGVSPLAGTLRSEARLAEDEVMVAGRKGNGWVVEQDGRSLPAFESPDVSLLDDSLLERQGLEWVRWCVSALCTLHLELLSGCPCWRIPLRSSVFCARVF